MKPAETKEIYEAACRSKRVKPQQEEGLMWHKALKQYEAADVKAALDCWWASTELDDRGQLKSKWLPAPGQLIPLIVNVNRTRRVESSEVKDFVAWRCPGCRYTCSGHTNDTTPRQCKRCGQVMEEMHRGRAA